MADEENPPAEEEKPAEEAPVAEEPAEPGTPPKEPTPGAGTPAAGTPPAGTPPAGTPGTETPGGTKPGTGAATPGTPGSPKDESGGKCVSPTPSGEEIPPDESNKIIELTLQILEMAQKKVDAQKIDSHSLSFMLLRIKESLDAYFNDYIPMLNTFLYHAEKVTADYFANMCCAVPDYGDYVVALKGEEDDKLDVGFAHEVPKQQLLTFVQGVADNYHAAAMFVKAGRANYKDINNCMPERKEMVVKVVKNIPDWLKLQDNVTRGLEDIRENTFKISAYVDFLKQGESKMAPTLDLTPLTRPADGSASFHTTASGR